MTSFDRACFRIDRRASRKRIILAAQFEALVRMKFKRIPAMKSAYGPGRAAI
jgi:hypothetical protein